MPTTTTTPAAYDDLTALFLNCSLKPASEPSHTTRLMEVAIHVMRQQGVAVEEVRAADHDIAPGVQPDMSDLFPSDAWPAIFEKVMAAEILVIGSPIWLGEESSTCRRVMERLYAHSGQLNDKGQYLYYGKVGGCIVTGNEDGAKHVAASTLYGLQHLGYTVPPQADAAWLGEAGPGPSYGDNVDGQDQPAGYDNDFTQRNTIFTTWNLLHMARLLKDAGGLPAYGNSRRAWADGERFGHPRASELAS
ncbi:MAG: NAD(P)H-dependent oxidoreductase [Planctomycetota bacterium]